MIDDEDRVRSKIRRAFGTTEPEPDPGLRARVVDSMPVDTGGGGTRWQWAAGGIAVLLTLAIVVGAVYFRAMRPAQPASAGHLIGALKMATQLDFHCSLPVIAYQAQARISMPDGGVTVDQAQPSPGKGSYPGTYVGGRWLPVPTTWVSADGRSYAYSTMTSGVPGKMSTAAVFVRDIASGKDRQLWTGDGNSQIVGWGPGGVYFTWQPMNVGGPNVGELWAVDPGNPAGAHRVGPNPRPSPPSDPRAPTFSGSFSRIAGGAAWGVSYQMTGAPVNGSPPGPPPMQIQRMDLRDGTVTTWYAAQAGQVAFVAAIDTQGHPVVILTTYSKGVPPGPQSSPPPYVAPPPPRVVLLTAPNQMAEIASGSDESFRPTQAWSDSHGIWFSGPGSLWIYRRGTLTKVADVPSELFPTPTPPPGKGGPVSTPPPGYPTGVLLQLVGACT